MKSQVLELTDQTDRTLIEQELEANIFVEAGAGSGKTHELVERICAMVDAGVELKSVAAITFTEKAAGELRERVRRQLSDASPTELRLAALNQLDTAPIGTIHSFAARIISEHPIEAGVPPLITVVDELRSQIAFHAPVGSGPAKALHRRVHRRRPPHHPRRRRFLGSPAECRR
jgi:ATP-dependent helicase/nuclease subunit A